MSVWIEMSVKNQMDEKAEKAESWIFDLLGPQVY